MVLRVRTSPNSKQKTTTKDDQVNPEWKEDFKFYLNPKKRNTLGMLKIRFYFALTCFQYFTNGHFQEMAKLSNLLDKEARVSE